MKHHSEVMSGNQKRNRFKELFWEYGFDLSEQQIGLFLRYEQLLLRWNSRANLISRRDEERVWERHFLESALLAQMPEIRAARTVLDLGTGGGFPGVPLKIVLPELQVTLLDSKRWKVLFLRDLLQTLNLEHVRLFCLRAEAAPEEPQLRREFAVVVSRAVAGLPTLAQWSEPFLKPGGALLAIKGSRLDEELAALRKAWPRASVELAPFPADPRKLFARQQIVRLTFSSVDG